MLSERLKKNISFKAGRDSIVKAFDFLKQENCDKKRNLKKCKDNHEKRVENCTSSVDLKKNKHCNSTVFSSSSIALKMRSCSMEHDWISLQRLIPLLLDFSIDREPILWRFSLIMFLNSSESHEHVICDFLDRCLGSTSEIQSDEPDRHLQQLLTVESLQHKFEEIWIKELEYIEH
ncbi:uncharacterized protein LOC122503890 [Leptopilina heterotoma]|uniref:uncharacterized protein LOC122503890 n=1 Tax=Leptopilina heterotoma TaxID=63436 RepID=UPI001CA84C0D|nr:uncharacterized protein LOC122503890 [Leptopilina heterotoma]